MVKNLLKNFEYIVSIRHFFGARGQALLPGPGDMRPGGQNGPCECLFMRKDMRENTSVHRLLRRALSLCLAVVLAVSLCVPALAAQTTYSGNDYVQRLKNAVRENAVVDLDAGKDPDEVVRAMVVTDVPAAVEQTGGVDYTAAAQSAESKTLRSQENIVRQARRITGRSVINQSGYLVSAFSMDMTRAQMKQVAALDGVVSVSEVTSYKARMTTAKDMTSAMELWKAENGGSTGEGIVVAVIDSGVNYSHPDMQMRQDAQLKYTQVFSYGAQLQEGENVVTVEFTDEATGAATTVAFTVVKDTAAPEAPVIAQGGDGKVTLTAAEEDVTLYYSYDGTEWVLYTGPFAPTATPVYAKAVDRAGNESAVSRLAVQVTAPSRCRPATPPCC